MKIPNCCIRSILKDGRYTIVIEGLFTWDAEDSSQGSVKRLQELARQYGFPTKCIVLRADKKELEARNASRAYVVPPDEI